MKTLPTSFVLTKDAKRLLTLLKKKLGISKTGIVELAIREIAKRERVDGRD